MRTQGAANWTPEREDRLRELWSSGLSASAIASVMGDGLTRNSIIGKAHRMDLAARRPSGPRGQTWSREKRKLTTKTVQRKQSFTKKRTDWTHAPKPPEMKPAKQKPKGEAWEALERVVPVSLLDLGAGQCKWPVTEDSPFLFCGAASTHGPYCHHHHLWSVGHGTASEQGAIKAARWAASLENYVPYVREAA